MLKTTFFSMLLLICTTCFCQSENIWKRKPWENLKKQKLQKINPSTEVLNEVMPRTNTAKMAVLKIDILRDFMGVTNKGEDVFLVKPFGMICISPSKNFNSTMPIILKDAEQESIKK